jgi:hypothetical protein
MLLLRSMLLEGFLSAIDSRRSHDPTIRNGFRESTCVSSCVWLTNFDRHLNGRLRMAAMSFC